MSQRLILRNPHSILAALERRPEDVKQVRIPSSGGETWDRIADLAKKNSIRLTDLPKLGAPRYRDDRDGGRAGLGEAEVEGLSGVTLEAWVESGEGAHGGIWLALDCLQDPHNMGAIFRTAAFFGIRGVLITQDRTAPLSSVVYDVASGGMESVPFATLTNLRRALDECKKREFWILGASEHAQKDVMDVPRDRKWILVIGNEEKGIRRLTMESCDEVCKVSQRGALGSLNASVAAGVLMAALVRS